MRGFICRFCWRRLHLCVFLVLFGGSHHTHELGLCWGGDVAPFSGSIQRSSLPPSLPKKVIVPRKQSSATGMLIGALNTRGPLCLLTSKLNLFGH